MRLGRCPTGLKGLNVSTPVYIFRLMEWYWWLLIGLAPFVIVAIVMGIVIYRLRRRERRLTLCRRSGPLGPFGGKRFFSSL